MMVVLLMLNPHFDSNIPNTVPSPLIFVAVLAGPIIRSLDILWSPSSVYVDSCCVISSIFVTFAKPTAIFWKYTL